MIPLMKVTLTFSYSLNLILKIWERVSEAVISPLIHRFPPPQTFAGSYFISNHTNIENNGSGPSYNYSANEWVSVGQLSKTKS
mmetsp:Transcript_100/g.138  ORF Transcript_100/g.138 Transcript_100/m.138 type:complete len:83 (-) Transcript_100:130-378(-)